MNVLKQMLVVSGLFVIGLTVYSQYTLWERNKFQRELSAANVQIQALEKMLEGCQEKVATFEKKDWNESYGEFAQALFRIEAVLPRELRISDMREWNKAEARVLVADPEGRRCDARVVFHKGAPDTFQLVSCESKSSR